LRPEVATVPGSHRCGVTRRPSMEERRRDVHDARRLEGTPTSMESRIRAAQEKGEIEVLTTGRSCSRRRLDRDGGTTWTFVTVLGSSLSFRLLISVWASSPRVAPGPAPPRPWSASSSGASVTVPRTAPSFPPPLPFLPCGGVHKNGENPKAGWWEATATPGSPYRVSVKAV
jgi:hypothetical protein